MLKVGWFSSGRGPGSRNLLRAVMDERASGRLDVDIVSVFCNWDNNEEPNPKKEEREKFFDLVNSYGIPLITLSWKGFRPELKKNDESEWRIEYGKEMRRLLSVYEFDIGILAGYMLWVDDLTCMEYDLLNLHPALPNGPKGTWQEVIWELIRTNASEQGSMIHLCTPDWDRGEAVTFCRFPIRGGDYDELWKDLENRTASMSLNSIIEEEGAEEPLFKRIRKDGAERELPLIISTIEQFACRSIEIRDKQLYHKGERLSGPFDLSNDVDKRIP